MTNPHKRTEKEDAINFALRVQKSLNERITHLKRENKHLRKENLKLLERLGEQGYYEYNSYTDSHEWVSSVNAPKKDDCQEKGVGSDNLI